MNPYSPMYASRDRQDYLASSHSIERPIGITIIAILKFVSVLFGMWLIWKGQQEIHELNQVGYIPNSWTLNEYESSISFVRFIQWLAAIDVVTGVVLGWGLLKLRMWAKSCTIGLAGLSVILTGMSMCATGGIGIMLFSLIINIVVIGYLVRNEVSDAFDYTSY